MTARITLTATSTPTEPDRALRETERSARFRDLPLAAGRYVRQDPIGASSTVVSVI